MKRTFVVLFGLFCLVPVALADDTPTADTPAPATTTEATADTPAPATTTEATGDTPATATTAEVTLEDKVKSDPNNAELLNEYFGKNFRAVAMLSGTDSDAAEKRLDEIATLIESLQPEEDGAKRLMAQAEAAVKFYRRRIEIGRISVDELVAKLKEKADDKETLSMYASKITQELSPIARTEPDKAEQQLTAAKELLEDVKSRAAEDETKEQCDQITRSFGRLEQSIITGKKLAALVGADAAPLEIEAWVNGSPLTDGDLKGKVVLLDFWSVWCGPCISTFPHLREWHEKYADKGLVIIGLTRYYNYQWDDEAGRAVRSSEKVAPEAEQEMLQKFAEQHNLHHRFAIQSDRTLSEFYAVSGIPHVVVIDREGKVQLVRVGAGGQTAHEIGEKVAQLIADGPGDQ